MNTTSKLNSKIAGLLAGLALLSPALTVGAEANWPNWRGADENGSTSTGSYVAAFDNEKNVKWKTALPAKGCSTPIVWKDQIIITSPSDGNDTLMAFGWDGKKRWQTTVGSERAGKHRNGSGSNPSAITDGKLLFAYFKSGNLAGFTLDGKLLWKTNLQDRFARDTLYWDIGTSPVLTAKHVVLAVMHSGESYLAAFDKRTGELAWKESRNYKTPVECDHSYATPHVVQYQGREAIVVWGAERLTIHNASNGKLFWTCEGFNPDKRGNWVQVASSVLAGNMAIIPYGRGKHIAGVELSGDGNVTDSNRKWTLTGTGSFVPTPAIHDGKVYVLGDRGQVSCLDANTGKKLWDGQFPKHRASYYASPTVADGKLYAPREDGVIMVASISDGFKFLSENNMGERIIATTVPVRDQLLIRGEKHLFCIAK
jgi:outer membrane protein assembly factor BamB